MSQETIHKPLIAHIIYRFGVGGLENGLVNLINNMSDRYRHAIICLTESTEFSRRLQREDVQIYELHKREGKDLAFYGRLWRLLRKLRPDIVHSRNLAALETTVFATLSGVPVRIHGEHGRDVFDLEGNNRKYQMLRRICTHFVQCHVALSKDLEDWLVQEVGIKHSKVVQFYNGVDAARFRPRRKDGQGRIGFPSGFDQDDVVVVGSVGRLEAVKDQLTLVKAFLRLRQSGSGNRDVRLVLMGDGSQRARIEALVAEHGAEDAVWITGNRDDVASLLPYLDVFVLPSLGEGISNTILEAMACGLPVVATRVGGNPELVDEGLTGALVPPDDPTAMAEVLSPYLDSGALRETHGRAGRKRVEEVFSLEAMVRRYEGLYDKLWAAKTGSTLAAEN